MEALVKAIKGHKQIDIICLGTPNIIGDSVGPLVGTMLQERCDTFLYQPNIIGTMTDPVIRDNFKAKLMLLRPDAFVVAIDAYISKDTTLIKIAEEPLNPGAAVKATLNIGDLSIKCLVGNSVETLLQQDMNYIYALASSAARLIGHVLTTAELDYSLLQKIKRYIESIKSILKKPNFLIF